MNESGFTRRSGAGALVPALLALVVSVAVAQTPFWKPEQQPEQQPPTAPAPAPATRAPARTPAAPPLGRAVVPPAVNATVIARIEGKALTQSDFDRIALPYFARMRAQFGTGFEGDIVKIANHNVLDELLRRELLRIEARRQKIEPSSADVDSVLARDPFFTTNGVFDRVKFEGYKASPQSNYSQMLPELRELAAMDVLDRHLRQKLTPTPAEVRAEWAKRNDQVKTHGFALLLRDVSLEPESTPQEWADYYHAHSDQFVRRTRIRVRFARLALPPAADSTRPAEQAKAMTRARAIADSLERKTLPDTSGELLDTGLVEALGANLPGVAMTPELQAELGRADSVASVKQFGPLVAGDAVLVGVIREREPKHLPPLREVMADVRRAADLDKRRTSADADRRALYTEHPERYKTARMTVTRVTVADAAIQTRAATAAEVEHWYADNWRRALGIRDTTRRVAPALVDSIRAKIRPRVDHDLRPKQVDELMAKVLAAFKSSRDAKLAARAAGVPAAAETLTLVQSVTSDSLFQSPLVDGQYREALGKLGVVQGPTALSGRYVVWRIDAADSSFIPPYEQIRNRVDAAFRTEQRAKDEAEARVYFDAHRSDYKTPVKYGVDCVRVAMQAADSIRLGEPELKAYYTAHQDRFRREEEVHARHLLIMARGVSGAEEAKARGRADSLLKAVRAGADFVELCKRFSQEPGAATGGGDLGFFGRGRMVKPFEDAAFALKVGEISDVVQTQFGFHIIRVEERHPAGIRPYDEVKAEIHTELAQARADTTARRAAAALRRKLALGGVPVVLAKPYGGVVTPAPMAANESVPGIGFVQGLGEDLPKLVAGKWAPTVYRSANQFVLVRMRERVAAHPAEFDEAKQKAITDVQTQKKQDRLAKQVAAVRAALQSGASVDSVAAPWGGLKENAAVAANAAFAPVLGFGPHIMPKILKLKPGELSDTLSTPLGVMWARLDQRVPADAATFKTQKDQVAQELVINRMNDWLEEKKKTVRIEVLRPDLREPKPGPYKTVTIGGGGD